MSNWNGASRTNYFEVKDLEAFKAVLKPYEVEVVEHQQDGKTLVAVLCMSDDGSWPSFMQHSEDADEVIQDVLKRAEEYEFDHRENSEDLARESARLLGVELSETDIKGIVECLSNDDPNDAIVDFDWLISEQLVEGEVAVLISAGYEKLRYVSGHATAIRSDGERVALCLQDIYELAEAKLGKAPTLAQY